MMARRALVATYRLQFHKDFRFADARALVPYLATLGISHVYCSPILRARAGSTHGYDVADPTVLNPELGTDADWRALVNTVHEHGMGIVLDIVPNHMGVGPDNPFWEDLLANGRGSRYASWFDIDWYAPDPELEGRIFLPVLGDELEAVIERGEIKVERGEKGARLRYFDHSFPLAPASADTLPNGDVGADRLRELLDRQRYLLGFWRRAPRDINYRRFFDVNELVALRTEVPEVFDATHALILAMVERGDVDGLRIDHVDGLRDPRAYLERLRAERPRPGPRHATSPPLRPGRCWSTTGPAST